MQPRTEHPKPQFQRKNWLNLNGQWTYCFDFGKSGKDEGRELFKSRGFENVITVPFCPESKLSGVGHTDFIEAMWYHRKLSLPAGWEAKRTLLHFGGVDYEAEVFIDGVSVGTHFGGSVSFCFDITRFLTPDVEHDLVVRVLDELRTGFQPRGKQSKNYKSHGSSYTRITGIWQTVWLESVDSLGIKDCLIIPDLDGARFIVTPRFHAVKQNTRFQLTIKEGDDVVAIEQSSALDGIPLSVSLEQPKLWSPDSPFLYDFTMEVIASDGTVLDKVNSYAGMRKIHIEDNRIFLNNKPLYIRFVLDQGYYPDGIWTAPSDAALKQDIELAKAAGFNGARLHQKVFEERFHYWADKLGYLTWAESSSWGCNVNELEDARQFLTEWSEIVQRDRNHPSIIAWTPLNETNLCTNPLQHNRLHKDLYNLTKALDPTRPVNDASGYIHVKTDLWTVHHYERPDELKEMLMPDTEDGVLHRWPEHEALYEGQPYLNDEFGGIKWIQEDRCAYAENTWGYGSDIKTKDDFYAVLEAEVDIMLGIDTLSGYCYTQLTDIEQEQNGIYNYDRSEKFDMQRIAGIFKKLPPS